MHRRLLQMRRSKNINEGTKIRLHAPLTAIHTGIYAGETWMTENKTNQMLDVFNRRCLRDILRVLWNDHMTNEELLQRADTGNLQDTVKVGRRGVVGHVLRLPISRPVSMAISWTQKGRSKRKGRPKRKQKGTIKGDLHAMSVARTVGHRTK